DVESLVGEVVVFPFAVDLGIGEQVVAPGAVEGERRKVDRPVRVVRGDVGGGAAGVADQHLTQLAALQEPVVEVGESGRIPGCSGCWKCHKIGVLSMW